MNSIKILQPSEISSILNFEKGLNSDPSVVWTLQSWTAPWREESLNHYLPQGWSFGVWSEDNKLLGYFLGQPLLFLDQQTQSLWVEYVGSPDEKILRELCETAIKLSREKHFQRVYLPTPGLQLSKLTGYKFEVWNNQVTYVKTVK